jgi:hypothetical protein
VVYIFYNSPAAICVAIALHVIHVHPGVPGGMDAAADFIQRLQAAAAAV